MSVPAPQRAQEWLLTNLFVLVARRGREPFIAAPILRPDDPLFPERIEPTAQAVRASLRKLMTCADLASLGVDVAFGEPPPEHAGEAVWFEAIEGNVCRFGTAPGHGASRPRTLRAMAHAVAHAWRIHHRLDVSVRHDEERLCDLSAAFLGFGLLLAAAPSEALVREGGAAGLASEEIAILLAAQLVGRGMAAPARDELLRSIPALSAAVSEAVERLSATEVKLAERLRLPGRVDRRRPVDAAPRVTPVEQPKTTLRVLKSRRTEIVALSLVAGAALAFCAGYFLGASLFISLALVVPCLVIGLATAVFLRRDYCADCGAPLPLTHARCPGCGARIVGDVDGRAAAAETERLRDRLRSEEKPPSA